MIVEQRNYTLNCNFPFQEYIRLYEAEGLQIQLGHLGNLIGFFYTEFGQLHQIVHMWGYSDLNDRARRREALLSDPKWLEYVVKIRPMLRDLENKLLIPAAFSPIR